MERFVIVDTCDCPHKGQVAQFVEGVGYCYMARTGDEAYRKRFDGMTPKRPTAMREFGFDVVLGDSTATFLRARESVATYEDGKPRRWQGGTAVGDRFTLPLVTDAKRKRAK